MAEDYLEELATLFLEGRISRDNLEKAVQKERHAPEVEPIPISIDDYFIATSETGHITAFTMRGDFLGYAEYVFDDNAVGERVLNINYLEILPQARRNGIATNLEISLQEIALQHGARHITMQVDHSNEPMIGLARRLGYRSMPSEYDRYFLHFVKAI